jgi:hypothetical protein
MTVILNFPNPLGLRIQYWGSKPYNAYGNWVKVFEEWARVHLRYWQQSKGDIGWWCGERTDVSLFANAIYAQGGSALQEYSDIKTRGPEVYRGRPDIYLIFEDLHFVGEAKFCWPNLGGKYKDLPRIIFEEALSSARQNITSDSEKAMAICFVSPFLRLNKSSTLSAKIESFLNATAPKIETSSHIFRADIFPDKACCCSPWAKFSAISHTLWPVENPSAIHPGCSVWIGII